jgi:GT2 family glycosyltransferase
MGKIYLGIPTIAAVDALDEMLATVKQQNADILVKIIDNSGGLPDFYELAKKYRCILQVNPENVGVAASWNQLVEWAFNDGSDHVIIANDDLTFDANDSLERMVQDARLYADKFVQDVNCHYSCFVMTPYIWNTIGCFDDGFWPAYYEDNDYDVRREHAGLERHFDNYQMTHKHSQTIQVSHIMKTINGLNFETNKQRFIAKWGSMEQPYKQAWKGEQPWPSTKYL